MEGDIGKRKRGRPSKKPDELRTEDLLVKLKTDEKEAFKIAADLAGVSLSSWVRERLRQVAVSELQKAEYPVAFLKRQEV
jgi:predicted HicB family RNase H-like nuclease